MDVPSSAAKRISDTYLRIFRRCPENPRMALDDWRLALWVEALGEEYEDLADEIYPRWRKLRYRNLAPSESVLTMLKVLHNEYQLALVTNGPSNSQWEKIRELRLAEHFDAIVVSGDLKYEKPQPEIFHRVCTSLGVEPFECLIVGDKIETDILGGFRAQLGITIWLPNGEPGELKPNPPPDFIVTDVSEIIQILRDGKEKKQSGKKSRRSSKVSGGASSSASSATPPSASSATSGGNPSKASSSSSVSVASED